MKQHELIMIGSGGHASVLYDCLKLQGKKIKGIIDVNSNYRSTFLNHLKYLGNDNFVNDLQDSSFLFINGIGSDKRKSLFEKYKSLKCNFQNVIHPSAIISVSTSIGEGVQILSGSTIQSGVILGDDVIINTGSKLDHDCEIGKHVNIAPGVTLCGNVKVDEGTHLGASTTVIQNINIGKNCKIGAGVLILKMYQILLIFPLRKL